MSERVTIHRDEWGVPHVFASSPAGAAYGVGWAQAEDRLEQLLKNYRLAAGTMAEAFGEEWIEHDARQRLLGHADVSRRRYREIPAGARGMMEAFQAGVSAYMEAHPEETPEWAPRLEPWQAAALGRYIIFHWPLGAAEAKLERRKELNLPFGSNMWAVRPERAATGCAVMFIDPHVPWFDVFRFYEFRAHAGPYEVSGFGPLGSPLIGLGHNAHLAWSCTTGGPDTTDIYVLETRPGRPPQYRYDGSWRDMTARTTRIAVRGGETVERELLFTHHGPVWLTEGRAAYALATPYLNEVGFTSEFYRLCMARTLDEAKAALRMNQLMEQNFMCAHVNGDIFYVRTGRTPVRPDGFDFTSPVPGWTSRSEWRGLYDMNDFVQIENPECGFMQNCNNGPDTMTPEPLVDPAAFPREVYNCAPGQANGRSRRALELLSQTSRLTLDDVMRFAVDTYVDGAESWKAALARSARALGEDAALRPALELLGRWSGRMDADSPGATLYQHMRDALAAGPTRVEEDALRAGRTLPADQQRALADALAQAARTLQERHGRLDVPWGDVHRLRRGERSWPLSGGSVLRAISSDEENGVRYGRAGQSWTQIALMRPGAVESYSDTPFGQSDRPDSPHFADQAEKLFSRSRFKPTWFQPDALKGHIVSTTKLVFRPGTGAAGRKS